MNIYYIIGLVILILTGAFHCFKQKYIIGTSLILISIFTYGLLKQNFNKQEYIEIDLN